MNRALEFYIDKVDRYGVDIPEGTFIYDAVDTGRGIVLTGRGDVGNVPVRRHYGVFLTGADVPDDPEPVRAVATMASGTVWHVFELLD